MIATTLVDQKEIIIGVIIYKIKNTESSLINTSIFDIFGDSY